MGENQGEPTERPCATRAGIREINNNPALPGGLYLPHFLHVKKLVRFTDVDWVTIPAREEKKEKAEFWDAAEGWLEEELVEDIFCDALDLFVCEGTDSIEIQGKWQRDLLDEKILREN